jgi:hypothetical protein
VDALLHELLLPSDLRQTPGAGAGVEIEPSSVAEGLRDAWLLELEDDLSEWPGAGLDWACSSKRR